MDNSNLSEEELFLSGEGQEEAPETLEQTVETVETPETPATEEIVESNVAPIADAQETLVETPEKIETDEAPEGSNVPSWRLREVNEAKAAMELQMQTAQQQNHQLQQQMAAMRQQLASQQQQKPAPDIYEDPQGFQQYQDNRIQESNNQLQVQMARLEAMSIHGAENVEKAWQAAITAEATNPGLGQRIAASPNPWAEAVAWNKERETQQAIGEGGIDGFRDRTKADLAKDPEFRKQVFEAMKVEAGGAVETATIQAIPSLNGAPAAKVSPAQTASMTDAELFLSS